MQFRPTDVEIGEIQKCRRNSVESTHPKYDLYALKLNLLFLTMHTSYVTFCATSFNKIWDLFAKKIVEKRNSILTIAQFTLKYQCLSKVQLNTMFHEIQCIIYWATPSSKYMPHVSTHTRRYFIKSCQIIFRRSQTHKYQKQEIENFSLFL